MISLFENTEPAPDLLRRFVATPHQRFWQVCQVLANVESNAEEVLSSFPEAAQSSQNVGLRMKIIVDNELRLAAGAAPVAVEVPDLLIGRAQQMLFAFDRGLQELVVFMSHFDRSSFIPLVLKLVCEHSQPETVAAS